MSHPMNSQEASTIQLGIVVVVVFFSVWVVALNTRWYHNDKQEREAIATAIEGGTEPLAARCAFDPDWRCNELYGVD